MQTLDKAAIQPQFQDLKQRLGEIQDLEAAANLLYWDQTTHMPPQGAAARGQQLATLQQLAHEKLIDPAIGHLLAALTPYEQSQPYDSTEASLIRITRHNYERAVRIPSTFTARLSQHSAASYEAWAKARPANDFASIQPYLEKTLDLSREYASFFPEANHMADPLIAMSDEGMTVEILTPLFADLRSQLVPLVEAIISQSPVSDACLYQSYPEAQQLAFGLKIAEQLGYDLNRGRQDKTLHPYMINFSINDVRITTRVQEDYLAEALFSTIHEAGHALYELGMDPAFERTPLAGGVTSGVHESQSRLWENLVGRSRPFWQHFYPQLQALFPDQLRSITLEDFYRANNTVKRSLIRTDADEVTYNLHIMIRFDLELALLEDRLQVADLPEAWNERYRSDLGLIPPDNSQGVMQDVHWYSGLIGGAFQGYTLGNLMGAQFLEAAFRDHPEIPEQISQGHFQTLHDWLKTHIYQLGKKYKATDLVERATGSPLKIEPLMQHLRRKFGEIYALD